MKVLDLPLGIHETSDYVALAIKSAVFYRIVEPQKTLVRIKDVNQQISEVLFCPLLVQSGSFSLYFGNVFDIQTAVATLAGIIRASVRWISILFKWNGFNDCYFIELKSLSDLGSRSQAPSKSFYHQKEEEKRDGGGYAPHATPPPPQRTQPFFKHVHDEFMSQLHDHVLDEWGIEIQNIRIESLKINDPELQKSISNNAIEVSRQHNR